MSFGITAQIWGSGPSDATGKLVLLALADYANDAGECWPAVVSLAEKCSLSERATRNALRRLEAAGWITAAVGGGRKGCSRYTVNPEPGSPFADSKPGTSCPVSDDKPGPTVPVSDDKPGTSCPVSEPENPAPRAPVGHLIPENPAPRAPEPIKNLSEEDLGSAAAAPSVPREAAALPDEPTFRERILIACGLPDPVSGLTGHGSARLGTPADMAVARRWIAPAPGGLGLTEAEVVEIVADKRATMRSPPGRLAYFDGAMSDFAASRDRPIPKPTPQDRRTNHGTSPHARADEAIERAIRDLDAGRINSVVAGDYAPGKSRRR